MAAEATSVLSSINYRDYKQLMAAISLSITLSSKETQLNTNTEPKLLSMGRN